MPRHYQIGDFSRITRLSVKTLRFYHEKGLLKPKKTDASSGYRYYAEDQIEVVRRINLLKELGLSLEEIKNTLADCTDDRDLLALLKGKLGELSDKITRLKDVKTRVAELVEREEMVQQVDSTMEIIVKEIPDQLIAGLRFKGRYAESGERFKRLFRSLGGLAASKPFNLYYDEGFMEEGADIESCLPLRKEKRVDDISIRKLSGGQAYTVIHRGAYDKLGNSYKKLADEMAKTGLKLSSPIREIYLKGPGLVFDNPDKYITEIQMFTE